MVHVGVSSKAPRHLTRLAWTGSREGESGPEGPFPSFTASMEETSNVPLTPWHLDTSKATSVQELGGRWLDFRLWDGSEKLSRLRLAAWRFLLVFESEFSAS